MSVITVKTFSEDGNLESIEYFNSREISYVDFDVNDNSAVFKLKSSDQISVQNATQEKLKTALSGESDLSFENVSGSFEVIYAG